MVRPLQLWGPQEAKGLRYPSPLPPRCCSGRNMLCKCCSFLFSLVVGGKIKQCTETRSSTAWLQLPKATPCIKSLSHSMCSSFSLWCGTWQKGIGKHTAFSFTTNVPYLNLWELGYAAKTVETVIFHVRPWGLPIAVCRETDSVWLL